MTMLLRLPVLIALMLLATLLAYANHFDNGFHFDDSHLIEDNAHIEDLSRAGHFFTDPATLSTLPTNRSYRPVLMVSYALDYWWGGGLNPRTFQISSFLLFGLQLILLVLLFRLIFDLTRPHRWNGLAAVLATTLYALHPANAETVNYISARSDIGSTLCVVAALLIQVRAPGRWRHLSMLPAMLGMLIKPTVFMLLPLILAWPWLVTPGRRPRELFTLGAAGLIARDALGAAPLLLVLILSFGFVQAMTPESWTGGGPSRLQYLITQPFVVLRYFWTFFIPMGLSADTDWTLLTSVLHWKFGVGLLFLVTTAGTIWWTASRRLWTPVAFGLLWFLMALLPSSSVIPLAEVTNDHRMYFPFVGLALAAGWVGIRLAVYCESSLASSHFRASLLMAVLLAPLALFAALTHQRNEIWRSDASLWRDVTIQSPGNGRGLMNYGLTLMQAGRIDEALDHFLRARETAYGHHPYLALNIGIALDALSRTAEADAFFEEALLGGLQYPQVHYFQARRLASQGRRDEALRQLEIALARAPGMRSAKQLRESLSAGQPTSSGPVSADNWVSRSLEDYRAGRYPAAAEAARRAIALRPDYAVAFNNLCAAYNAQRRWNEAIMACEQALHIDPNLDLARNNLAWALDNKAGKQ